jgi:hypothetical protein
LAAARGWLYTRPAMHRTVPPAFCAGSPYERPRPLAMIPRGPATLTAATTSSTVRGVITRATEGDVRPHP